MASRTGIGTMETNCKKKNTNKYIKGLNKKNVRKFSLRRMAVFYPQGTSYIRETKRPPSSENHEHK